MHAVGVGDIADDGSRVGIEDHNVRAARDINAPGFAVDREIIPTAVTAYFGRLSDVITGWPGAWGRARQHEQ